MTRREKAEMMLDVFDERAPTNINWNMADLWLDAIEAGLKAVEEAEKQKGEKDGKEELFRHMPTLRREY